MVGGVGDGRSRVRMGESGLLRGVQRTGLLYRFATEGMKSKLLLGSSLAEQHRASAQARGRAEEAARAVCWTAEDWKTQLEAHS